MYDAYIAGRMSAALAASVRCGLFDLLDRGALDAKEIARRLGFGERPTRSLLAALVAMGLVRRAAAPELPPGAPSPSAAASPASSAPVFALAADASAYLVRGKPGWLGGLIDLEIEHFLSPAALLEALRRGDATVYGEADPWERHEADPEAARRFTEAMHSVSERPAAGLAEVAELASVRRLLDVGGGSGALSIALAAHNPRLECVVWDLAVVCPIARENARAAGVGDRVTAIPGDMFAEPWPAGFDAVLLSQILHDWSFDDGRRLLARAAAALPPKGVVLIHEKLVDEDGRGPLANALGHLDMLLWTEGQQYTESELRALLLETGFEEVRRLPTAGYWSLVTARRA